MSNKPRHSPHPYLLLPKNEVPTEAICPMCQKTHYPIIFWTGRGIPRIYCLRCRERLDNISTITPAVVRIS